MSDWTITRLRYEGDTALRYITELETKLERTLTAVTFAHIDKIEASHKALREALEKIVKITPENEFKKWPHHHRYLIIARDALEKVDE
jgi:hypothetical protein